MPRRVEIAAGLELTGDGAAWVHAAGALVIADVPLAYARAARRRGGWLPAGERADAAAMRALAIARSLGARHVVIAGDLRHSTRDADDAEHAEARVFLRALASAARTTLVPGNHDRGADAYADTGAEVLARGASLDLGDAVVTHEPPADAPARWTVCGHLHPATVVRDETGAGARYPCALVGPRVVVLPAFGEWAGGVTGGRLRRALFGGEWREYPLAGGEVWPPRA